MKYDGEFPLEPSRDHLHVNNHSGKKGKFVVQCPESIRSLNVVSIGHMFTEKMNFKYDCTVCHSYSRLSVEASKLMNYDYYRIDFSARNGCETNLPLFISVPSSYPPYKNRK